MAQPHFSPGGRESITVNAPTHWIRVCAAADIDQEDVRRFDVGGRAYAIFNAKSGFFATADLCTHGGAHLSDGLVMGDIIECPLHQGRFHIPSGEAKGPPACRRLRTYPIRVEGGELFIQIAQLAIDPSPQSPINP
jgi:3-phenylpropionate/trans-cinnamate dioxygenase ferredoxin component